MTTPAAEAMYQAQHLAENRHRPIAVFNPHGKPVGELPVIYGFNNGGSPGWLSAELIAEDGTAMGGHCCSHECYMPHDLGILEGTRPDRHEKFREHYPAGYRMEFVDHKDAASHAGLGAAIEKHLAKVAAQESQG